MEDKVKALVACGVEPSKIAMILDMSHGDLIKRYGHALAIGEAEANASVAKSLYKMATSGKHPQASIFWLKSRANWRDNEASIDEYVDHNTPREEIIKRIQELEQEVTH